MYRSLHKKEMPYRFAEKGLLLEEICRYSEKGISISLPDFMKDEIGQVHFAAAWSNLSNTEPATTWFAVDVSADDLLAYLSKAQVP